MIDSDGTVIFTIGPTLTGGSKTTEGFALNHAKPVLHISSADSEPHKLLGEFVTKNRIKVLNVAGPRASGEPEIGAFVISVLEGAFA